MNNPNIKIEGWNIRDLLAGNALAGILSACPDGMNFGKNDLSSMKETFGIWATVSYAIADAMLDVREK